MKDKSVFSVDTFIGFLVIVNLILMVIIFLHF